MPLFGVPSIPYLSPAAILAAPLHWYHYTGVADFLQEGAHSFLCIPQGQVRMSAKVFHEHCLLCPS